jgi:uncharacterized transporter YbjL
MVVIRCGGGVEIDVESDELARRAREAPIHALFLLVSGDRDPGRHLRILAHLAGRIEDEEFMDEWLQDRDEQELKETLLRDERFMSLELTTGSRSEGLIGHALKDLRMPEGSLVALIRRYGRIIVPRGGTVLMEGDRLTVIGDAAGLREMIKRFGEEGARRRPLVKNAKGGSAT